MPLITINLIVHADAGCRVEADEAVTVVSRNGNRPPRTPSRPPGPPSGGDGGWERRNGRQARGEEMVRF
jgi:hypothetical protein